MPRWPELTPNKPGPITEIAWAAGLFDGEGTTCVHRPRREATPAIRMVLSQKDTGPEILLRVQSALGVGNVRQRADRLGVWIWVCTTHEGCKIALGLMWPYLSSPKRNQAMKVGYDPT